MGTHVPKLVLMYKKIENVPWLFAGKQRARAFFRRKRGYFFFFDYICSYEA